MIDALKNSLWKSFGASIDMLKKAIEACPEEYWTNHKRFFYIAYHTTIFLDCYLTIPFTKFSALLPFTLTDEEDIPKDAVDDVVPDKIYSTKELLGYVHYCREKCRNIITALTEEALQQEWINASANPDLSLPSSATEYYTVMEILFFNMRHVQHHAAQLYLLLRQTINDAPEYVTEATDDL